VFTIRLVQSKLQAPGYNHKSAEQTLFRARMQLKSSEVLRGGVRKYGSGVLGGSLFSKQIRRVRRDFEARIEDDYLADIEAREPEVQRYFYERFQRLNITQPSRHQDEQELALDGLREDGRLEFDEKTKHGSFKISMSSAGSSYGSMRKRRRFGMDKSQSMLRLAGTVAIGGFPRLSPPLKCETLVVRKEEKLCKDSPTPWYETVNKLKQEDEALMNELFKPMRGKARLKASALTLLSNKDQSSKTKRHRQELDRFMTTPIYRKLVAEDAKIKRFVDRAESRRNAEADQEES